MKGTIKRFTSLMLALLMTLALLPMEVLAAENVSDFTQLTELTSEAQIASTPAIQPLADAATAVPATFSVGSQTYSDLNDAITAAQSGTDKTIVVATDGSLSGSYTIPAGVTLLVPFDDANTLYKETPTATRKAAAAKAYRKLVLAADAALTVEGAISVGGQYYSAGGSQIGGMVGNYGHLWLNTGAAITVKSGGALYAWGFVSGNGAVAAESGAKVYEWFQIGDFRGGRATMCMGNNVFPFSQYFIQNIESPLTIYSGAEEILYTDIYASDSQNGASVTFIGNSGMFKVLSGSLTKQYDAAQDRMVYTVDGKAELNSLSINSGALRVDSSEYVLPITNNMTLHITPRSSITTNQDIALLPGVQVYVDKAAELTIAARKKAYIYDSDQWTDQNYVNPNAKFKSVLYSPTKSYTRTNADLVDALVDVNGTLIAAGAIYTTKSGADVCSSQKTGRYIMKATSGTETITYQYTQSGSNVTSHDIGIDPIRLKNDDGSYTDTKGAAQDQYNFEVDKWLKCQRLLVIFDPNYTGAPEIEVQKVAPSTDTPLLSNPFTRENYTFNGWNTAADGSGTSYADGDNITLTADTTLYAQWRCSHASTEVRGAKGATCTAPGYTGYTYCTVCNEMVKKGEVIHAKGHTEVIDPAVEPTCTAPGKTAGAHCSVCGTVIKAQEEIPAKGHRWNEGEITTAPTCENAGVKTYTCTVCNATKTEAISATGHTPVDVAKQPATCTEAGHTAGVKCSVCGATISGIEVIPATGHKPEIRNAVEATLTTPGYTGDTYCSVCNELLKQGTEIPKTGAHITWVIDGKVVAEEDYLKGTMPSFKGSTDKAPDENYRYTFTGWSPEVVAAEEDATYTAQYSETARVFYTITFNANGGEGGMEPQRFEVGVDTALNTNTFTREGYKFIGWNTAADGSGTAYADEGAILELTGDMTLYAQWQFWNGWFTDVNGKQYYKDGELQKTGWTVIDDKTYYLDTGTGYAATGIATLIPDGATEEARCVFDAEGVFQSDVTGVYTVGNDTYWLNSGIIEEEAGLKRVVKENGEVNYYYFAVAYNLEEQDWLVLSAAVNADNLHGEKCWLHKTNNLLPAWFYEFDENGVIPHEDTKINGIQNVGGTLYYYIDGIKAPAGMIQIDNDIYYVNSKAQLVCGQDYYCSRTNDLKEPGYYTFDADGKMVRPSLNGIVKDDDGVLRYYVNGKVTYVGLIEINGDYYYVRSNGEVVTNCTYYITWTHDLKEPGYYVFDAEGKLIGMPKNGIVEEDGTLRYYANGEPTYVGLIKIGRDYYYVNSKCEVVHSCTYYVSWTHGLIPEGKYTFDAKGRMMDPPAPEDPTKSGIVEENGALYYYESGVKVYAGLIQIDGDYYYVNSSCKVVTTKHYWVNRPNDLLPAGFYDFGEDGKMLNPPKPVDHTKSGIVTENGTMYYYVDGVKTYAGLIQIDGDYYYVNSSCKVVTTPHYWVNRPNDLLPAGFYDFGEDGKMLNPPTEDGKMIET